MTVVPPTKQFGPGNPTPQDLNVFVTAPLVLLMNPPFAQLRQTGAQSIPGAAFTAVTFDVADYDTVNGFSTSHTTRYTCQLAGVYRFDGHGSFASNVTGVRATGWAVNGSGIINGDITQDAVASGGTSHRMAASTQRVRLAVGDYVECLLYQTSGGALNTAVGSGEQSSLGIERISS